MKRARPLLWITVFTVALLVPSFYAALYAIENVYEVTLTEGSFRFERPWAGLLFVGALLVLIARAFFERRRTPHLQVSKGAALAELGRSPRLILRYVLPAARFVALSFFVIALMGPQSIHARDNSDVDGIDIVVAMDVSDSMRAADVEPNRFEGQKAVVGDFVSRRPNDRIGAVIFGRDAYTLMPLTTDKDALRTTIAELELGMVDGGRTAIGNALGVSLNRLRRSTAKSKVVILLSDGESNSGNIAPTQAAEFAKTMGVKVYTVLMGASDDAPVQQGLDFFQRPIFGVNRVPVNPALLSGVAATTGGEFFQVGDRQSLERTFHQILDRLEKSQIEDVGRIYGELFPALLWPALALLLLEALLGSLVFRRWP